MKGFEDHEDSNSNYNSLIERKYELNKKIRDLSRNNEDYKKQINKLEVDLLEIKKRYNENKQLNNTYKRNLDNLYKSRSWWLTLVVRKLGSLFKNKQVKSKMSNTSKVSVVKQKAKSPTMLAVDLERKLWGGHSTNAIDDLKKLKVMISAPLNERTRAARSIARWYYDKGQFNKAFQELEYINDINPADYPTPNRIITEIKVMKKLNKIDSAKERIWSAISAKGLQSELCIGMAHLTESDERLNWYNLLYERHGFLKIKKINESKPLSIENIESEKAKKINMELNEYKVSVIMPVFNAEKIIHVALDSLINQTIKNLEIIVVDDCSTDNTVHIVSAYAEMDSRVKLIVKDKNEGAYAARNLGLRYVTGDFVTVHDSDDWSHPQKIEEQLKELIERPNCVGSISSLVRANKDICPLNPGSHLSMHFITINSSSLLVRKHIFDKLGGWDSVRVAGDSEFIFRIESVFGKDSLHRIKTKVPLSISLVNENSLTGTSMTHIRTIRFGLRRTYREAAIWWHSRASSSADLYLDPNKNNRPFPCPVPNEISSCFRNYDYLIIADYTTVEWQEEILKYIKELLDSAYTVSIYHIPDYKTDPKKAIADNVFEFVNKHKVDILVPQENVGITKAVVMTPSILDYKFDHIPRISLESVSVLDKGSVSSEIRKLREDNLVKLLQQEINLRWETLESLYENL